ncbi:MAG: AAA family ATPase [Rhodobacteraceae bacterium]|nr:AAA family ATPase [Paracoccaceae bacterium]
MVEETLSLNSVFAVLKRQKNLILMVCFAMALVTGAYLVATPAKYTASSLIQVFPNTKNLLDDAEVPQNFSINNVRVEGEVEILASNAVAALVVANAGLLQDPEFATSENSAQTTAIRAFQRASTVTRKGQTYILSIAVTASNPDRAAQITNIWADSYISYQISQKVDEINRLQGIIETNLNEIKQKLASSESSFDQFISDNLTEIERFANRDDLTRLQGVFSGYETALTIQINQARTVEQNLGNENWRAVANGFQNQTMLALVDQKDQINTNAPIDLQQQLLEIDQQLLDLTNTNLDTLQNRILGLQLQKTQVMASIRNIILETSIPPSLLTEIYALQQEAAITRDQYDLFIERRRELALQAELQVADSRIISAALPPLSASRQDQKTALAVAAAITFFLGIGLAFMNEARIAGFTSEPQLTDALNLPVAARIPAITGQNIAGKFTAEPMSRYTESIRKLRAGIDQCLLRQNNPDATGHVIMVVSSVPGEGKSNTSIALAQAYALSGKRTLLIDCDLRNPKIHRLLAGNSQISLLEWLNQHPIPKSGFYNDPTGMQVLTGTASETQANDQIFCSPKFQSLIEFARQDFDIIIFDTPPVLPIVDSAHLAKMADVIALTVKWASTKQSDVRAALKILKDSKPPATEIVAILSQEKGAADLNYYNNSAYYNKKGPRNSQPFENI